MRFYKKSAILLMVLFSFALGNKAYSFGFYAHKKINRMAVFALPPQMISFFKKHIDYISEHAIDPDKRSRAVIGEDVKHYIDLELYGDNPLVNVPKLWKPAVEKFTEDTLQKYGINPWSAAKMVYTLTQAFKDEDFDKILYAVANLGHYIADACTPLHTTHFYDGQISDQKGIHSFWETRIPELYGDNFNYLVGRADYIDKPYIFIWQLIAESHQEVDSIFAIETFLRKNFPQDAQFVYDEKGTVIKKQFSKKYCDEFNKMSNNMVERRMRRAVYAVSSLWYTAWINAGQPDLSRLENKEISKEHQKELNEIDEMWKTGKPVGRPNPD